MEKLEKRPFPKTDMERSTKQKERIKEAEKELKSGGGLQRNGRKKAGQKYGNAKGSLLQKVGELNQVKPSNDAGNR